MSQREKEIEEKISQLEAEKRILNANNAYYDQNLSYSELEEISGISIREFKRFQQDHDYPYRVGAYNKNDIFDRIKNRIKDIDKEIYKLREKVLGVLDQLIFIPSWNKLLGSKFNGFYLNQPVQKVLQDNVVLLPDLAITGFEETTGEPFFLITGVGLYWVKFELGSGSLVTDYREITGIVLPWDIYEKAQDQAASILDSEKIRMTEYMTSIPFSIILQKQSTQMYLRGVLARNVFLPYRECFDQLKELCQDPDSFKEEEGLKILSGGLSTQMQLYNNELLTEKQLGRYSNLVAGVKNTQPKLNKILANLQLDATEEAFFQKIQKIKSEFSEIGRKYLVDWVPGHVC